MCFYQGRKILFEWINSPYQWYNKMFLSRTNTSITFNNVLIYVYSWRTNTRPSWCSGSCASLWSSATPPCTITTTPGTSRFVWAPTGLLGHLQVCLFVYHVHYYDHARHQQFGNRIFSIQCHIFLNCYLAVDALPTGLFVRHQQVGNIIFFSYSISYFSKLLFSYRRISN